MSVNEESYRFVNARRVGNATHNGATFGVENPGSGYGTVNGARESGVPKVGMTAKELADYQSTFTRDARMRLLTVGADQYSTDRGQKFEGMSVSELVKEAKEELLDVVNYAAMLGIKLDQLLEKLQ